MSCIYGQNQIYLKAIYTFVSEQAYSEAASVQLRINCSLMCMHTGQRSQKATMTLSWFVRRGVRYDDF